MPCIFFHGFRICCPNKEPYARLEGRVVKIASVQFLPLSFLLENSPAIKVKK
jgi:hypothetical protein